MQRESSKDTQIQQKDINLKVSPLINEQHIAGSWEDICSKIYHCVLYAFLSMLFLQFLVLAFVGVGHRNKWLHVMTQEGHSLILFVLP